MTPRTFTFVKNVKGWLYIELDTYDMMGARKTFVFGPTVDKLVIPYPYALGLFVSQGAMDMYEQGIFTIENVNELYKVIIFSISDKSAIVISSIGFILLTSAANLWAL